MPYRCNISPRPYFNIARLAPIEKLYSSEVPGSPVPEPKLRDSRFKYRLGTGLGIDTRAIKDSESVSEPKLRNSQSRNQNRNRNSGFRSYSHNFCCFYSLK